MSRGAGWRFSRFPIAAVAAGSSVGPVGCGSNGELLPPTVPLTPPAVLCNAANRDEPCRSVDSIESMMRHPELRVVDTSPTPGGTQGAHVLTLRAPGDDGPVVFRAKWRPEASAGMFNEPRRELGAYAVQRLVLPALLFVIPPTEARCIGLTEYRERVDAKAEPTFSSSPCVLGYLSYWLGDVVPVEEAIEEGRLHPTDGMLDMELFRESEAYRTSLSNLNVMTFLVDHGDAHGLQFLISARADAPWVYSVDNSISFRAIHNPMLLFRQDWSTIQVPAFPEGTVRRLQEMTRDELDGLRVMSHLEPHGESLVATAGAPLPPEGEAWDPVRWHGSSLLIGLSPAEIDSVWSERNGFLEALQRRI